MTYPVVQIPPDASTQLEQMGTKAKFWYTTQGGITALFKQGRPGTGENWAEKVCCELARELRLPHARYELALWNGRQGVTTPSIVPDPGRLILGNELLATVYAAESYNADSRYRDSQHTLRRVMAVLRAPQIRTPLQWNCPIEINDALGVFCGYLMLDALIGNQDRHHENWGLIFSQGAGLTLAPSFDHASSLGRNETDANRLERLTTKDQTRSVAHFASRAKSAFFDTRTSSKPMGTLEAFSEAMKRTPAAGNYWLEKLSNLDRDHFQHLLAQIPDTWISEPARDFAAAMLLVNQDRLLALRV